LVTTPVGYRQIAGYGVGDFAMNLYWSGTAFFLLYWYTDVAGLPNEVAGFLFFVGSAWDAVTDPGMGILAERTRTRWGRYRPYLLLGSIPLAASFMLLLWVPPFTGMALTGTLIAAHLLFRTAYTVVGVPYSALSARLTHDSQERTKLAGARMLAAATGGLAISASAFPLVSWLGNGNEQDGFFTLGILAGTLAVIVHIICFATTYEPDMAAQGAAEPKVRLVDVANMVASNRPFVLVFLAVLFMSSASVLMGKNILYFVKYGLGEHDRQHVVVLVNGITALCMIPVWTFIAHRIGKRATWLVASSIACIGLLALYLANVTTLTQFVVHMFFVTLGVSAFGVLFWSMLPDTVEYGEWKTGVRSEAIVFGFTTFAQKVSIGLAGWILGYLLTATGYESGQTQSAETIDGLLFTMTIIPTALYLGGALLVWYYPVNKELHARIVADIAEREMAFTDTG
jgi:GPH family glycoside/pentoside/hexuronide:cation symporter